MAVSVSRYFYRAPFSSLALLLAGALLGRELTLLQNPPLTSTVLLRPLSPESEARPEALASASKAATSDCYCRAPLPALSAASEASPLVDLARRVALGGKVLLAVSTFGSVREQLEAFAASVTRLSITNFILVALDDEAMAACPVPGHCVRQNGIEQPRGSIRERLSAKKFGFIAELIAANISVLLSDTDIVLFDNPFCHLGSAAERSDVEGMTDGWSPATALGWHEMVDDPPLPAPWQFRIVFMNSGFFFVRASTATLSVFRNISARLAVEDVWDQAAYNDELWFPRTTGTEARGTGPAAHGGHQLRIAVLDWKLFANSKVALALGALDAPIALCPVIVHINYHGDKPRNMGAQAAKYKHCLIERAPAASAACAVGGTQMFTSNNHTTAASATS
jgi:hypothetical protein